MRYAAILILNGLLAATAGGAVPQSIINSPHNLSASGPGGVRAVAEEQVCIFCHTPHKAGRIVPLWNRMMPTAAYQIYQSNSLQAQPGQPTGSSKLCLSCHDGTIALGSVLSRDMPIAMAGGITTLPPGKSNLGTDLSDDHPVSFRYDNTLVGKNPKLKNPSLLPAVVRLDKGGELQCTSCHDAHNNAVGKFLVMDNANSQLCASCHIMGTTDVSGHVQCAACHQPHTAPSGPYLLKAQRPTDTCLACHNGGAGQTGKNIAAELAKLSKHDTSMPANQPNQIPQSATCKHCHEPHTMRTVTASAPNIQGNLGRVAGVSAAGAVVAAAQYEYEVCFKCHGDQSASTPLVQRQIVQSNTRLEFASTAISSHPVTGPGRNTDVPSLLPPYTTASIIRCSDCHTSDTPAGAAGVKGTHGSNVRPLLKDQYVTVDNTSESAASYALCYRCHSRTNVLSETGPFRFHKKHVVDAKTPCSVCHDAHGISSAQGMSTKNSHLINFDTRVVRPDSLGRLEFRDLGARRGECYLTCHGRNHNPESY